jgi:hypothetical protein
MFFACRFLALATARVHTNGMAELIITEASMRPLYALLLLTTAAAAPAFAFSPDPEIKQSGDVRYVSGGIGDEDEEALNRMARDFDVKMVFSASGHYVGEADVTVTDAQGETALRTTTDGPILLVDLKPGTYAVNAEYGGIKRHATVTVNDAADVRTMQFTWRDADAGE